MRVPAAGNRQRAIRDARAQVVGVGQPGRSGGEIDVITGQRGFGPRPSSRRQTSWCWWPHRVRSMCSSPARSELREPPAQSLPAVAAAGPRGVLQPGPIPSVPGCGQVSTWPNSLSRQLVPRNTAAMKHGTLRQESPRPSRSGWCCLPQDDSPATGVYIPRKIYMLLQS